jgi:hypothetical protein
MFTSIEIMLLHCEIVVTLLYRNVRDCGAVRASVGVGHYVEGEGKHLGKGRCARGKVT